MVAIVTDRGIVHYEAIGRGKPVILLHCWLGSWNYWLPTMQLLGSKHKTYALDFWGFGDSAKHGAFSVVEYVEMVNQFMERLGLERAPVMGHSMGGTVSLSLALTHPQRVSRVAVVGSPIVGSGLALPLKLAGNRQIARLLYRFPGIFAFGMRIASRFYARDWRTWYGMFQKDLSGTTMDSFSNSIRDLRVTDLRPHLQNLSVPTMGVYGNKDNIVDPKQGRVLQAGVKHAVLNYFEGAAHFPMLDEKDRFNHVVVDFLDSQ